MCRFRQIVPGIHLLEVPFFDGSHKTGVVVVNHGEQCAVIDSGECSEAVDHCIIPALQLANIGKPDCILCTHNHGDHTGGHARLREILRRPVYVYDADASGFPTAVDKVLYDGDLPIPGLRLIAAPGHTASAVCFLHEESGTLISGDSFQGGGTEGVGLALIEDVPSYRESIHRMLSLDLQRIVAGHRFAPCDFVIEGPMRVRAFLQYCLDTTTRYESFIAQHANEEDSVLTERLIESEGRVCERYIVRGDGTVRSFKKYLQKR